MFIAIVHPLFISIHAPPRGATADGDCCFVRLNAISIHAPPRGATFWFAIAPPTTSDFNSRPSARGDRNGKAAASMMADFNSRPSARGDVNLPRLIPPRLDFNSRPSARGDMSDASCIVTPSLFQFTPLREGRRVSVRQAIAFRRFQFTPLREGRLDSVNAYVGRAIIFQFTPLREGRRNRTDWLPCTPDFNSRPSARGDRADVITASAGRFQFTPLREGRRSILAKSEVRTYFNSRPSARGDQTRFAGDGIWHIISIHAPPRGATLDTSPMISTLLFQFTPLREGRRRLPPSCPSRTYFNSRPSARGDLPVATVRRLPKNFNSRPSARGDGKRYAISANLLFNPYKSAWLNNRATQFVEIILVIFHRIIV